MSSNSGCSKSIVLLSTSASATRALGRGLGALLVPGDVVLLGGELGAGKTTLVSGVAEALEVDDVVWSPTFTLVRELPGKYPIAHMDLYRLDSVAGIEDLGLDELLDDEHVLLVEWGDLVGPVFGPARLEVALSYPPVGNGRNDSLRELVVSGCGESWGRRWAQLEEALGEWLPPSPEPEAE